MNNKSLPLEERLLTAKAATRLAAESFEGLLADMMQRLEASNDEEAIQELEALFDILSAATGQIVDML